MTESMIDAREWNFDMNSAPRDGTVVEVVARYPEATAGFPRYAGFYNGSWCEFSRRQPEPLVAWAWRHRTDWPDERYATVRDVILSNTEKRG